MTGIEAVILLSLSDFKVQHLLCISLEVKAPEYFGLVCRSVHLSAHLLSRCCVHLHQHQASFSSQSGTRSSL